MKKLVFSMTVALLLPGLLTAYPGIGGGRGLFRVQNALVEPDAGLTISLNLIGSNPMLGTLPVGDANDKGWVADLIAPELSYAPLVTEWVGAELFANWGGIFQYGPEQPMDANEFTWGLHDLRAGAKLSIPFIPVLKLGGILGYRFIDREEDLKAIPAAVPFREDRLGWTALATIQLQDLAPSLPNLMVNYTQDDDLKTYGAGVELAAEGFALFAEAQSVQPEDSDGIFDADRGTIRLTPGVAFGTGTSGLTFKAGYSFGLSEGLANELLLGLVIATPFGKREPPELGIVAGRVVDARTGDGLVATITLPDLPQFGTINTSPTGVFRVERIPVGVVELHITAEGYRDHPVPVNVPAVSPYEFRLHPLVTYGVISGSVTDAATRQPLAATIEFPGTDFEPVESDPATGAFQLDNVPTGIYTATASADGYFKGSRTIQVEEGRVASPTFELRVLTERSTFTGKVSDRKTDEPLAATVEFPEAGIEAVKSDGATGVFNTELPLGPYAVKVSAEGYIPQTAAIVIQRDQPLIRDFQLVQEGMVITLRGVHFDFDRATIRPESRPVLDDAAKILKDNPDIRVEIQGHTDNIGAPSYNQRLSERRAQAVVSYLVRNHGIGRNRLIARGYGEDQPVESNATPEGRALNRRVDFVVLGE